MSKRVPRAQASAYRDSGDTFLAAAEALSALADAREGYGNAIGLLAVHAVIAYTDTLTIQVGEQKSQGEHRHAAALLRRLLGAALPRGQETRVQRVLAEKDALAYQGEFYTLAEARAVLRKAEEYVAWARNYLATSGS